MSLIIALASAKHSPGVTTLVQTLASANASNNKSLVVELDPAGGDLAARQGLSPRPGLKSLIVETRHDDISIEDVGQHVQQLRAGGEVLLSTPLPFAIENMPRDLPSRLLPVLRAIPGTVFVDCGQLQSEWQLQLLRESDVGALVLRPSPQDAHQAQAWMRRASVSGSVAHLCLVQVGASGTSWWRSRGGYHPSEVEEAIGFPVAGAAADDLRTADAINSGTTLTKQIRTSPMFRSAEVLLDAFAKIVGRKETSRAAAS